MRAVLAAACGRGAWARYRGGVTPDIATFIGPAARGDRLSQMLTRSVWALGVAFAMLGAALLALGDGGTGPGLLVAGLVLLGLCLVYRRLQPMSYVLDDVGLEIRRRAAPPERFAGEVALVSGARLAFRTFGSGGLYGYLGRFRLGGSASGPVRAYVTDRGKLVVLDLGGVRIAISPDDREALVELLVNR
jgi:hypothetical protein